MAVTGSETYTTTYTYDANNRLTQEDKKVDSTTTTTVYTYDANGNLLQKSNPDGAEQYDYNGFNQLTILKQGTTATGYTYNASGIRTAKRTASTDTYFLLDGGDVVAEYTDGELTASYLRGINLVLCFTVDSVEFYLHNAHGDVIVLTNGSGTVTKRYDYDAFGNEENPDSADTNPFRYCGEYFDKETKTYYLRARYYGFTQQDTHWSPANAIYGDNPRKINERQDALGLNTYAYAPEISAIMQSGNLYVYCTNSPVMYHDPSGQNSLALTWTGTMWWLTFADGPIPLGDIIYAGGIVVLAICGIGKAAETLDSADFSIESSGAISTPASPPPDDDDDDVSNYRKYSAEEIERRYNLKKGQYHREIKRDILADVMKSYKNQYKTLGKNPNVYLSPDGRIMIVSTQIKGVAPIVTDLYIWMYF